MMLPDGPPPAAWRCVRLCRVLATLPRLRNLEVRSTSAHADAHDSARSTAVQAFQSLPAPLSMPVLRAFLLVRAANATRMPAAPAFLAVDQVLAGKACGQRGPARRGRVSRVPGYALRVDSHRCAVQQEGK